MLAVDWAALVPSWLPPLQLGLLITDGDLVIRYWCSWLERHSGAAAGAMVGQPLLDAFPDLESRGIAEAFRRALAGEATDLPQREHGYVIPLPPPTRSDGFAQMQQRARVVPLVRDGAIVGTVCTITDLTGRAAEAQATQHARREAEQALKLRDSFFSVAAHELRTPLTTLLGRAQLLQRWLERVEGLDERTQRSAGIVVEQAQRLNGMVAALLDVSRIQGGRFTISPARVDLVGLVRRVVEDSYPTPATHRIELDASAGGLPVEGDESRLEQVLVSLIDNAVKYSPDGERVLVRLSRNGTEATVAVVDQGIGIPVTAQTQLFRRFFRAENAEALGVSGLGISLFTAREILELHGGRIEVDSAEGRGSTFRICLPLAG